MIFVTDLMQAVLFQSSPEFHCLREKEVHSEGCSLPWQLAGAPESCGRAFAGIIKGLVYRPGTCAGDLGGTYGASRALGRLGGSLWAGLLDLKQGVFAFSNKSSAIVGGGATASAPSVHVHLQKGWLSEGIVGLKTKRLRVVRLDVFPPCRRSCLVRFRAISISTGPGGVRHMIFQTLFSIVTATPAAVPRRGGRRGRLRRETPWTK